MKLTKQQVRAVRILCRAENPVKPKAFARAMWPDAEGWQSYAKCGAKGVSRGGGMVLAAGGYLGRLRVAGIAKDVSFRWCGKFDFGYRPTEEALRALPNGPVLSHRDVLPVTLPGSQRG